MAASLDRLVLIGQLKREPPAQVELDGLVRSGMARLGDAQNASVSLEGRFDLAYNAAHALSLAALRWYGYRSENRFVVFQTVVHTLKLPAAQMRVLSTAHTKRNHIEYEGIADVDEQLVAALIRVTREVAKRVAALGPVEAT